MSVDYAIANTANQYIQGGLEIATSKNGGNVTVTAKLYFRRTNSWSGSTYENVTRSITIDGTSTSSSGQVTVAGGQQNVWQGPVLTATKTFTGAAKNITISWNSSGSYFGGSGSANFTVPAGYVAPSGGYITITEKTHNSVTAKIGVNSFGTPNTNKALEFKILSEAYVAGKAARQNAGLTNGSTTTVTNSSATANGGITIIGNKTYHTGLYASNGALDYRYQGPTFTTLCPPLSELSLNSQSYSTYNTVKAIIKWTRQSDGNALSRRLFCRYSTNGGNSWTGWKKVVADIPNSTMSGTFELPDLPTNANVIVHVVIVTNLDSEPKVLSFNTLTTHAAPNFSDFEWYDNNPITAALTGNNETFIQGQSTPILKISTTNKATGNQSIGISSYNASFSGENYFLDYSATNDVSKQLAAPTQSGVLVMAVSAVDTLSSATKVTKDVTVYPWAKPNIVANVVRENGFEADSTLSIKGTYSPLVIDETAKNTITVKFRYKKSSSSEWSAWENRPVTLSNSNWTTSDLAKTFDNAAQWDIQVQAIDKLATTTVNLVLPMGIPKFFIGVDGRVAVGERPKKALPSGNNGQLEIAGKVYSVDVEASGAVAAGGNITGNNLYAKNAAYANNQRLMPSHVGQIIMSTSLTTAAAVQNIYDGTWVAWGTGKVPVGVSTGEAEFNTVNKTGGSKTVTLTKANLPYYHLGSLGVRWKGGHGGSVAYANSQNAYCQNAWQGEVVIESGGGDTPHNNLPPYQTTYFWRRTV